MIITCQEKGHTSIVHSPAASSLGKMLINAAKRHGISLINIVRRPEQVKMLQDLGAENIIDTSSPQFESELAAKIAQLKPSAFFDGVGGQVGSKIFSLMPENSTTYCFGILSGDSAYSGNVSDLLFKGKSIKGWWITAEFTDLTKAFKIVKGAIENMVKGEYKTNIVKTFPPSQFKEAIDATLS